MKAVPDNAEQPDDDQQSATGQQSAPIQFRSDVTVELVRSSAHDSDVLFAARVSTLTDSRAVQAGFAVIVVGLGL